MSTTTFVPFNAEGIDGLELWEQGFEMRDQVSGVWVRFIVTSAGTPQAVFGTKGPRGGWYAWKPGGDVGKLLLDAGTVRRTCDVLEVLEERWIEWMQANEFGRAKIEDV